MPSLVDIANMALGEVGSQSITTLDEATTPAVTCKRFIYQAIREVLQSSKWKCARVQAELGQLTDEPSFDWAYAYQLPADYVRLVSFNEVESGEQLQDMFEVQGNTLLTDETTASIVYVRDLSYVGNDVGLMPALLVKACYINLASKIAWPIQQSRTLKESLEQTAEVALRKAKAADSREEFRPLTDPAAGSRWIASRG